MPVPKSNKRLRRLLQSGRVAVPSEADRVAVASASQAGPPTRSAGPRCDSPRPEAFGDTLDAELMGDSHYTRAPSADAAAAARERTTTASPLAGEERVPLAPRRLQFRDASGPRVGGPSIEEGAASRVAPTPPTAGAPSSQNVPREPATREIVDVDEEMPPAPRADQSPQSPPPFNVEQANYQREGKLAHVMGVNMDLVGAYEIFGYYKRYHASDQRGSAGSCAVPGAPYVRGGASSEEKASSTVWFGEEDPLGDPLDLSQLRYAWRRFPRKGVVLSDVLDRSALRPDLERVKLMATEGVEETARDALGLLLERGSVYQVPDELLCDRTFAVSVAEALYIDRAGEFLFNTRPGTPVRAFPLATVPELYTYPTPFAYSRQRVAVTKAAASVMRLTGRAFWPTDWLAHYDRRLCDAQRVDSSLCFSLGLTEEAFPRLPERVIASMPPLECSSCCR